jgi:hypothetical protein
LFSEAFIYVRIYEQNGRQLWRAAFSRMDGMFFRPGGFLSDIWWHFVLPPDPMVYHLRNFVFCAVNLFLLHRVLLKLVRSRSARIIALVLFAVSKIHLTIIGYANLYEVLILLMSTMLAVLFWLRYVEARRGFDYALTLLFCTFSAYSKDNGFIVVGVLAVMILALAIKPGDLKSQALYWGIRLAPLALISGSYLMLRYAMTGPINPNNPVYSPRLSFPVAVWQAKAFLATVGNLSLTNPSSMGEKGLAGLLVHDSNALEVGLWVALWVLIIFTLYCARSSWRLLTVAVVWTGSYLFPIFLIRNHQVYYHQEPLVGVVLLIGICLDRAKRTLVTLWLVAIALIAGNGLISNQRSYYTWQYTADRAAAVVKPIVAAEADSPPKDITFVSSAASQGFWIFAIGGPLIPQLLRCSNTKVNVVDSSADIKPGAHVYYLPD